MKSLKDKITSVWGGNHNLIVDHISREIWRKVWDKVYFEVREHGGESRVWYPIFLEIKDEIAKR